MTFDVEQALSGLLAWDFSITHSGKTVAVRPLALADLAALVSIGKSASPSQALINLLAENGPEIEAWVNRFAVEHVLAALHAISVYAGVDPKKLPGHRLRGRGGDGEPDPVESLWRFHAGVMEASRTLSPREAWAMRIDEASRLCAARAALLNHGRNASAGSGAAPGGWRDHGNGTRSRQITGLKDLYAAFGKTLPDGMV